jgi:hypothetical protein
MFRAQNQASKIGAADFQIISGGDFSQIRAKRKYGFRVLLSGNATVNIGAAVQIKQAAIESQYTIPPYTIAAADCAILGSELPSKFVSVIPIASSPIPSPTSF